MISKALNGRIFWGLLLLAAGVIWLLSNLEVTTISLGDLLSHYWPVILIYFGAVGLVEVLERAPARGFLWGSTVVSGVVTAVGVILLGNLNGWWAVELSLLWKLVLPALLLIAGFSLLRGGLARPGSRTYWSVMGGAKVVPDHWHNLSAVAIMGGSNFDLRRAELPLAGEYWIEAHALMGGVDVKVPANVRVTVEWMGIMGGAEVLGRSKGVLVGSDRVEVGEGDVHLHIRATTVMGGVKVVQGE